MENIEQLAFVLHSRPYREHQQIVELLTENFGKISAVAYSGKTLKSSKKALLQPFSPINVLLKGKSNLKNLSRVEISANSYSLKGEHLYSGFYLNELLVKLMGELDGCPNLFYHYQQSLHALSQQLPIEPILRKFEIELLDELGFSLDFTPVFDADVDYFYYIAEQGFIPCVEKLNTTTFKKSHLEAIAQADLSDKEVLKSYKLLMRQVLHILLGGKPLNSRKLFTKHQL